VAQGQAENQGKAVSADVVLWSDSYLGSMNTMVERNFSEPSVMGTSEGRYGSISTNSTPIIGSIDMVPATLKRYGYTAIYFRKATAYVCGLTYSNLPDSLFPTIRQNAGALVKHVIPETPAFKARILVGDVVVKVNNRDIDSRTTLSRVINGTRGQTDTFIVIRDGEPRTIVVRLNP
jgi:membrane-associated protease RseP (regulator of RpoE activity)